LNYVCIIFTWFNFEFELHKKSNQISRLNHKIKFNKNIGHVCFLKFTFREITFQTSMCLFVIRKVGQRKTLSGQRKHFSVNWKHFSVKKKFGLVFRKVFSFLAMFVFRKVVFRKPLFKLSCVCLPLEKLVNRKHFLVKEKFGLVFRKVFPWKIWAENTFRKLWKI